MGAYHVENRFYVCGGLSYPKYFSHFRKILANGECIKLPSMPTPKAFFNMTQWKEKGSLFTVGGYNGADLK